MDKTEIRRKWDLLPKEKRLSCIEAIVTFFQETREEKIGIIAAEDILDFFLRDIRKYIYNKGVEDSKEILKKGFNSLDVDLAILQDK
ncbi:MAG: DUF2164 family protein [Patescibacteria group bacterium]|jgi:uncharacterized protein (DUF2164 family)